MIIETFRKILVDYPLGVMTAPGVVFDHVYSTRNDFPPVK